MSVRIFIVLFFLCLPLISFAQTRDEIRALDPANPVEREIAGGETHTYQIKLVAGQFLRVVVEQKGIDVALALAAPDDKQAVEVNLTRAGGLESLSYEAVSSGDHRLTIRAGGSDTLSGTYRISPEVRAVVVEDKQRIAAERLLAEAAALNRRGPALAEQMLEKSVQVLRLWRELGDRNWEAHALVLVGVAHRFLSRQEEAIGYYEQAMAIARETKNRYGEAISLQNMSISYALTNRAANAIEYSEQALPIFRELKDRTGEAGTLNTLGNVYNESGRQDKSIEYHEQALAIRREIKDRRGEADSLNNLGSAYSDQGRLDKGIEYREQALAIHRELKNRDQEGPALANLGLNYFRLGRYDKAIEYLEQAVAINREAKHRVGEANSLNGLGLVYKELGRYDEAIKYFEQSLAVSREAKYQLTEGDALENLGFVHRTLGHFDKAVEYLEQALGLFREIKHPSRQGLTLSNLGAIYGSLGRYDHAAEYFEQALSLAREAKDRWVEAFALHDFAKVERDRGNLTRARTLLEASLQLAESERSEIFNPESRASYFASVRNYNESYIDLLIRLHRAEPARGFDALAFEGSERAHARGLLELLTEAGTDIRQGVEASLLERERTLAKQLHAKAASQVQLLSTPHTPEQAAQLAKEISQLESDYEQVQAAIRRTSPRYAALVQPQPLKLKEIQQQLDSETLLLEYALGDDRSYLWAVTKYSVSSHELPKLAEVAKAARQVYELLTSRSRSHKGETAAQRGTRLQEAEAQLTVAAQQLSQMILGPVAPELGKRRLLIVADGALQYIPFAMLPEPQSGKAEESKSGISSARSAIRNPQSLVPLVVNHEIVSLPSASALAIQRAELAGRQPAPKLLAVIADPVFDRSDERFKSPVTNATEKPQAETVAFDARSIEHLAEESSDKAGVTARRLVIPRLPFTRQEATRLLALTPKNLSFGAMDFQASRETILNADLSQYRYVHFATHGLLDSERPGLSSLVLSMVDAEGKPQDGFLRANDIYNLKLPAELVVLSACQTGLGKEIKGEGLIGLTRGFMYAGAARVVVSLWNVNDKATADLMTKFYEKMLKQGERPAAALRAAQVEMWKQKQWQSPYYWAAFTMQGEWR